MLIAEPTTMLTDYAIAAEVLIFAGLLFRLGWLQRRLAVQFWAGAFICVAIAATLGGTYHGFSPAFSNQAQQWLWQLMIYAISGAGLLMLAGTIISTVPRRWQLWCLAGVGWKFLIYVVWTIADFGGSGFQGAVADYLSAMLAVLFLMVSTSRRRSQPGVKWVVAGILVSALATVTQWSGLTLAAFNANDLYHLVEMAALYFFYRGAQLLKDW